MRLFGKHVIRIRIAEQMRREHISTSYQNTTYNAARAPQMSSVPAKNPFDTLNMEASTAKEVPEELSPPGAAGLLPSRLMITIPMTQKIKTISIRSKKGISKTPVSFALAKPLEASAERSMKFGTNFKKQEHAKPPMVAKSAAFEVVRFQKKPRMNMAKIPGLTKPVYSWMY
jgi:hypothetical protein